MAFIYLGQKWSAADIKVGKGSVFLGGPRNRKGKSWRVDFINKFAESGTESPIFIPEGTNQLKGGFCRIGKDEKNKWQRFAAASAKAIVFWFPADAAEDVGSVDVSAWYKNDRVFIGRDPTNQTPEIIKLMATDNKVHISTSIEALVGRVVEFLNRE